MTTQEFAGLYDEYSEKIYKFIYFRTHHKETAEDLTSKTFIKAVEKIHTFNSNKGQFSTWLYSIARNTVIDHYRTNKEHADLYDILDLRSGENLVQDVGNRMKLDQVKKYLEDLPTEQRDLVLMRVWDDLSYKDIAEILGKSEASCKVMFSRIIKKIGVAGIAALLLFVAIK